MTEALFIETAAKEKLLKELGKRRLNVSGVLRKLGVSRSGYLSWVNRLPSDQQKRRIHIKERILQIYHGSNQNYGAPKITRVLRKEGKTIAERTVGKYMQDFGIKAQYIRPYTATTIEPDVEIDVSKDKHDCFITNSDGEVLFNSFTIPNTLVRRFLKPFSPAMLAIHSCPHKFHQHY